MNIVLRNTMISATEVLISNKKVASQNDSCIHTIIVIAEYEYFDHSIVGVPQFCSESSICSFRPLPDVVYWQYY